MKKGLRVLLAIASILLLTAPSFAIEIGADATEETVSFDGLYDLTYILKSEYRPHTEETDVSPGETNAGAEATISADHKEITLSATSSAGTSKRGSLVTSAQDVLTTLQLRNDSGKSLKINYSLSTTAGTGVTTAFTSGQVLGDGDSIEFQAFADTTYDNEDIVTASGVVTINSIEVVNLLTVELHPSQYGSYTYSYIIEGTTYHGTVQTGAEKSTQLKDIPAGTVLTLTPTVTAENKKFYAWRSNGGVEYTENAITIGANMDIIPAIIDANVDTTTKRFLANNQYYMFWEDAIAAAKLVNGPVVLLADYTLPSTLEDNGLFENGTYVKWTSDTAIAYEVPLGVTFVVPYSSSNSTTFTDADSTVRQNKCTNAYKTLTVPEGRTINVNGTLGVNAKVCATGNYYSGLVYNTYGKMVLGGTINVSGSLYARGYIIGTDHTSHTNGSGTGCVNVASGGKVYVPLQIIDHRGGTAAVQVKDVMFPVNVYYFQNIMVRTVYAPGASMYGQYFLVANDTPFSGEAELLSSSNSAFFQFESNATGNVTMDYQYNGDRTIINVNSAVKMNKLSVTLVIKILVEIPYTLDTVGKELPLAGNMTINIGNGGKITCANDFKLIPGAELNILSGGELDLSGSVYLYSKDVYEDGWSYSKNRERLLVPGIVENLNSDTSKVYIEEGEDAVVRVGGTLNVIGKLWQSTDHPGSVIGLDGGKIVFSSIAEKYTGDGIYEFSGAGVTQENTGNWWRPNYVFTNPSKNTKWEPITALLAGKSATSSNYLPFKTSTTETIYYATGTWVGTNNAAWYQNLITVEDGKYGIFAVNSGTSVGETDGYVTVTRDGIEIPNVVGYSVNGGTFMFTTAEGVTDLKCNGTTVSDNTVSNITADSVLSFTRNVARIVTTDGNTPYDFLSEAVDNYTGSGYIEVLRYIQEPGFPTDKTVYLDLNGNDITFTSAASFGTLYGIDTTTNDYAATADTAGKIIGDVSGVQSFTTTDRVAGVSRTHVPVTTGTGSEKTTSFYRASVAVTGAQFLVDGNGDTYIIFRGQYKGNEPTTLQSVGFVFNDTGATTQSGDATHVLTDDLTFYYGRLSSDTLKTVTAQATVDGATIQSVAKPDTLKSDETPLTFQDLLDEFETKLAELKTNAR